MSSTGGGGRTSSDSARLTTATRPARTAREPPERLLREEDAEAFDDQPIADADGEDPHRDGGDAKPVEAGVSREELDLVRVYLSNVGKRKLLKAREEQELGRRIEDARAAVQGALAPLPCAVKTLVSLAEHVRDGSAPAAELILLPDGGELKQDKIDSVLASFDRIRKALARVDGSRRKCSDKRSSAATRTAHRKIMQEANAEVASVLSGPAVAPVAGRSGRRASCARWIRASRALDDLPRDDAHRHATRPRRPGLPAPPPLPPGVRGGQPARAAKSWKPSASCSKRTCGSSSRSRSAT